MKALLKDNFKFFIIAILGGVLFWGAGDLNFSITVFVYLLNFLMLPDFIRDTKVSFKPKFIFMAIIFLISVILITYLNGKNGAVITYLGLYILICTVGIVRKNFSHYKK